MRHDSVGQGSVDISRGRLPESRAAFRNLAAFQKETAVPGLLRGVARTAVVAGTATAVSNRVSRRQQGRWAQQEYQEAPPQPTPPAPPPSPASADDISGRIDQLKQLGIASTAS